jgi:hypothetical protein
LALHGTHKSAHTCWVVCGWPVSLVSTGCKAVLAQENIACPEWPADQQYASGKLYAAHSNRVSPSGRKCEMQRRVIGWLGCR